MAGFGEFLASLLSLDARQKRLAEALPADDHLRLVRQLDDPDLAST